MKYLNKYYINLIEKEFNGRYNPDEEYLGVDKQINKEEPVVSVLVSTYQHEQFIRECISSILKQKTDFQYEILIGEDGSSDGTRDICKEIAENHTDRIRLFLRDRATSQFYDSDGNYVARFNVSWLRKSSRGEFIAICEGDDYWIDSNKLQKQVDALRVHTDCSFCFHPAKIDNIQDKEVEKFTGNHFEKIRKIDIHDMIKGGGHYSPTASIMINRKVNEKLLQSSYIHLFPVLDYYVQILSLSVGKGLYLPDVMSAYRVGVPGSWNQNNRSVEKKVSHMIEMMISNRFFNKKLDYKYHRSFIEKEKKDIRRTFKNTHSYNRKTISRIKSLVNESTSGDLFLKCRWQIFMSYLYYKLNFKSVIPILRKIKIR